MLGEQLFPLVFYVHHDESTMHHSEQYLQTKYTPRSDIELNLST